MGLGPEIWRPFPQVIGANQILRWKMTLDNPQEVAGLFSQKVLENLSTPYLGEVQLCLGSKYVSSPIAGLRKWRASETPTPFQALERIPNIGSLHGVVWKLDPRGELSRPSST